MLGVWGWELKFLANLFQYALKVSQNLLVVKANYLVQVSLEPLCTDAIVLLICRRIMNAAVQFNDQAQRSAVKIPNAPLNRFLPNKLGPIQLPISQSFPQNCFSRSWVFTIGPGQFNQILFRVIEHITHNSSFIGFIPPLPLGRGAGGEGPWTY